MENMSEVETMKIKEDRDCFYALYYTFAPLTNDIFPSFKEMLLLY